jgi:hypothetical protein
MHIIKDSYIFDDNPLFKLPFYGHYQISGITGCTYTYYP